MAAAIGGELRHGIIDGVEVDFRHPDLPASDWEARPFWHVWASPPSHAGIIFPAEAAFGEARLRGEKQLDDALPAIYANPGDKVTVTSVVPMIKDRRFDHPHDAQHRLAYLRIERPNGDVVDLPEPLAFYGVTQIREGALRETFDHLAARIALHAGVQGLESRQRDPFDFTRYWDRELSEIALRAAQDAHRDYFGLLDQLPEGEKGGQLRARLRSLINAASLAGFMLGKVEARKAERMGAATLRNQERAVAAVARTDWTEKAEAIWKDHPEYSRTRVAKLIAEGTDDDQRSIMRRIQSVEPSRRTPQGGE